MFISKEKVKKLETSHKSPHDVSMTSGPCGRSVVLWRTAVESFQECASRTVSALRALRVPLGFFIERKRRRILTYTQEIRLKCCLLSRGKAQGGKL